MGQRAELLDILEPIEIFDNYMNNIDFKESDAIGDMLILNLRNRIFEEKLLKLEDEIYSLREKFDSVEVK